MAMFVDQLSASPHHRLNQILHTLKHVYACELPVHNTSQLQEWAAQAQSDKKQIVETHTFNSYMQQPAYVKANLILEAIKMLTEVAPKRRKTVKEHEESHMKSLLEGKQKPDFLDLDKDGNKKEPMAQAAKQAAHKKLDEKKGQKPDFLDLDKDGNKKEPMAQAAKQAKQTTLKEFEETIPSDHAFDKIKQSGGQNVRTTSDAIRFVTKKGAHSVPHYDSPDGDRYVKMKDLNKVLGEIKELEEAKQDPEADKLRDEYLKRKLPTYGNTRVAKGAKYHRPGSGHVGRTASAQADAPMVRPSSVKKLPVMAEKWDAEMKTAPKDVGKWEGYTIAQLKARKQKLMDKESRSAAEQKEVRQINFAIRAKQENHWGKVKEQERVLREDQNLDKAQTLLAAKDITDRLQDMAEDAAKMAVDDLMPLVDIMKDQFGLEAATAFNNVVKQQLQTVLDSIIAAKDQTDNAINTMETGGMPSAPADIGQPLPPMGGAPADAGIPPAPVQEPGAETGAEAGAESDIDFEKEFAASPATSGPEEEPLGRAKKEVAEATLTPAQQKAQADLARTAAEQMAKTGKKPDGTMATSQERADAKKLMTEKLTKKMTSGEVISDFVHSDDPKFKGKSKAERTKMALGAYYGMHPEKKLKESVAQVRALKAQLDQAVQAYQTHVHSLTESWIHQQGDLRSAVLQREVTVVREQLQEAIAEYKQHKQELTEHVHMQSQVHDKIRKLDEQMQQTPFGVRVQLTDGRTLNKFFESVELRDTWVRYNQPRIQHVQQVGVTDMQQVRDKLSKLV